MTETLETRSISWVHGELTGEGRHNLSEVVKEILNENGVSATRDPRLFKTLHERFYRLAEHLSTDVYAVASETNQHESSLFVDIVDFALGGALHEWAIQRKHRELGLVEHQLRILKGGAGHDR
jgi:hypothetical protein